MYKSLKGMADVLPDEAGRWQKTEARLRELLHPFGYREIRTPMMEETELFARSIGEGTDVVEKEMFTFVDQGGTSMSLRPEGTAPVARSFLEHHLDHGNELTKLYYMGPMFRHERPQKGRYRQFHSLGIEAIGSAHPYIDAEIITVLWTILSDFEVPGLSLELNSVGDDHCRPAYREKLSAFLTKHRADLSETVRTRMEKNPMRAFDSKVESDQALLKNAPTLLEELCGDCQKHLAGVSEALKSAGVPFTLNPRIVRGLDYYTRTAFEVTASGLGAQSAVAGGGRYDRLLEQLGGTATPAVGFGLGLERLLLVSTRFTGASNGMRVEFLPLDDAAEVEAFRLSNAVRTECISAQVPAVVEVALELQSLKSGLRRADKKGAHYAVLLGSQELSKRVAVVKNLKAGTQDEITFDQLPAALLKLLRGN